MDNEVNKYATNLVYLTTSSSENKIENSIIDSIFNNGLPKRADIYWFVHVNILDEPYAQSYSVKTVIKNDVYFVEFNLGFREEPRIGYYFKQVVNDLIESKEVSITDSCEKMYQKSSIGDFRFVVMDSFLSYDNKLSFWKNFIMKSYYNLKLFTVKESINFGLDKNSLQVEKYPLIMKPYTQNILLRKN